MEQQIRLTVLMTVYNGEAYLRETIESILNQTYRDFEYLILDNASEDDSREIIRSYNDPRIRLEALPENIGQVAALNKGLDMIETLYVARIDADDIAMPRRLERQVAFMDAHPGVGVCGTFVRVFYQPNENNPKPKIKKEIKYRWPTQPEDIKVKLLFECCLPHPGVMLRKTLFDQHGLRYDEEIGHSFDWELWQRASEYFDLANLPEFHLRYRLHPENESKKTAHLQEKAAMKIYHRGLERLGIGDHPLGWVHRDVAIETFKAGNREPGFLHQVLEWFEVMEAANKKHGYYREQAMHRFLRERLFVVMHYNMAHPGLILKLFLRERLYKDVGLYRTLKFVLKALFYSIKKGLAAPT